MKRLLDRDSIRKSACQLVHRRIVVLLVVSLAVLGSTALAASGGSTIRRRTKEDVWDARILRPIWVSDARTRIDAMTIEIMHRRALANKGYQSSYIVEVPARPQARSPFAPPMNTGDGLPPWIPTDL